MPNQQQEEEVYIREVKESLILLDAKLQEETDDLKRKNWYFDIVMVICKYMYGALRVHVAQDTVDIDTGMVMAGNVYTFVQYLKRLKNEKGQFAAKFGAFELKGPSGAVQTVLSVASAFTGFDNLSPGFFKKIDYQIMMPMVVVLTNLKSSLEEVRMGLNTIPSGIIPKGISISRKRTNEGQRATAPISAIGLGNQHSGLLHGLTFPPEKKTVMLKGLGPMTLAIMLASQPKYNDKIRKAFVENVSHLDMAEKVADSLILNKDNWTGLIRSLADVLLIASHKGSRRFYFPLEFYIQLYLRYPTCGLNNTFSFNGIKMLEHYVELSGKLIWKMRGQPDHKDALRQYLFHGIFTGGLENLGLLSKITNFPRWINSSTMSDSIKARFSSTSQTIVPINFLYISKGSRALPVGNNGGMIPMYTGDLRFAGNRTLSFSVELRNYLRSGKTHVSYTSDVPSLISALNTLKLEAEKNLDALEATNAGTTSWFKVKVEMDNVEYVQEKDFRPVDDPYGYFYV